MEVLVVKWYHYYIEHLQANQTQPMTEMYSVMNKLAEA